MKTIEIGKKFEIIAQRYLKQHGLKLIDKNYHSRYGEIDLIMRDQDYLVFIEVKYRKNLDYGGAISSINVAKQQKIIKTAQEYLVSSQKYDKIPCRFDVLVIEKLTTDKSDINWIKNAFGIY